MSLQNGYNGNLTSREAGSIGGQMVKKMCPIRTARYARTSRVAVGHRVEIRYMAELTV